MKELFTGKAKELFEEYFSIEIHTNGFEALEHHLGIDVFYSFPLSMQIGVIEDFAERLGYEIDVVKFGYQYEASITVIDCDIHVDDLIYGDTFNTKKEARELLIKQLNNIINEKTNLEV